MTATIRAPDPVPTGGPRRRRVAAAAALLLAAALALPPGLRAELVVLAGGGVLKVRAYKLEGERARLELASGGTMLLPLMRVERVVEDEIVEEEAPGAPSFALAFQEGQEPPGTPFSSLIYETARRHSVNPDLVAAVVRAESAFDTAAVSAKGARGLMQLMPATARRFGVEEAALFDPAQNLEAGVRYLAWLGQRFAGELPLVLAAYNAGEGVVDRYSGVPPYRETHAYLERVYGLLGLALARR